jgi:redox-sensitive bicupin YhaK (pirin superfamily)
LAERDSLGRKATMSPRIGPAPGIFTAKGRGQPGGSWVRRLFPVEGGPDAAPFLLLEQIGPLVYGAGKAGPSPSRPLNALEAGTYVLEGELEIAHSGGHRAVLGPGDIQWATVGKQVTSTDVPGRRMREQGGTFNALRVWMALPSKLASVESRFQEYPAAAIPLVTWQGATARVVAGDTLGMRGPVEGASPVTFQVWSLPEGSSVTFFLPPSQQGLAYVLDGTAGVGSPATEVQAGGLVLLWPGERVHLHGYVSPASVARVLVLAADPALRQTSAPNPSVAP